MRRFILVAAAISAPAMAQDPAASLYRSGTAPMTVDGAERPGQPITLAKPAVIDPARQNMAHFATAYRRAGAPRIMILWNRELTADVESEREDYVNFSSQSQSSSDGHRIDFATPWANHIDAHVASQASTSGEMRSGTQRIDPGRHASPNDEATDSDIQRGFSDALGEGGAKLVDRVSAMRTDALRGSTSNIQALEMRAVLDHADVTLEVVPLDDSRSARGVAYKIVARDARSGRVIANLRSTGDVASRPMPYVAGEHGFVRAAPREPSPYEIGRQVANETMATLASRL